MIAEAHEIRENQTYRQAAINQAKQLQNHSEEMVSYICLYTKHLIEIKYYLRMKTKINL